MIYEHAANGTVRLAYDFPSSLMSRLDTEASLRPQGSSAPSPTCDRRRNLERSLRLTNG